MACSSEKADPGSAHTLSQMDLLSIMLQLAGYPGTKVTVLAVGCGLAAASLAGSTDSG